MSRGLSQWSDLRLHDKLNRVTAMKKQAEPFLTFYLADIPIEVKHRNLKTMRLTVYPPDGKVVVSAPAGTSLVLIKNFTVSKLDWIKKQRERLSDKAPLSKSGGAESLRNNSTVYVWGIPYRLQLVIRNGNSKIKLDDETVLMYCRPLTPKAKKQEILDRWYRRALKEAAPPIIEKWEAILNVKVNKLHIRKMKSKWGSCNYNRQTMRLNSELAKRKPELLEYVIVHEMLHIIESSHNKNFYRLMGKFMPEWKVMRKQLNSDLP